MPKVNKEVTPEEKLIRAVVSRRHEEAAAVLRLVVEQVFDLYADSVEDYADCVILNLNDPYGQGTWRLEWDPGTKEWSIIREEDDE